MTFPLPPNEAVIYAEFVRLLDAREVDSVTEGSRGNVYPGLAKQSPEPLPSATEPLFPNERAA